MRFFTSFTIHSVVFATLASSVAFAEAPQTQDSDETLSTHLDDNMPIINGDDATVDDYPMTGATLMKAEVFGYPLDTMVCSSTLIAPDVVLLAAHCVDPATLGGGFFEIENPEMYWTRQADLSEWDGNTQSPELPTDAIKATSWVFHEEFSIQGMSLGLGQNHDIALLFLSQPVLDIYPAYLPTVSENGTIEMGDLVEVVGWGQQVATSQQQSPPAGSYAHKQKGESYIAELMAFEFKVGENPEDVRKCHGDSGGPSFWESAAGMRIIGVTSHAYDNTDCFETGGVDTRVSFYRDWIEEQLQSHCADGTRVWCDVPGIITPNYFEDLEAQANEEEEKSRMGCASISGSLQEKISLPLLLISVCVSSVFRSSRRKMRP